MLRTSPSDGIPPQNRGVEETDAQSIGKLLGTPGGVAGAARSEEDEMILAGSQQAWDECHLGVRNLRSVAVLGLRMATVPPRCTVESVWEAKALGGHNHKAIYGKNEYTTHRALFDGRGVCPSGQEIASLMLQFVTHIKCFGS
jgi:hypothetical protein